MVDLTREAVRCTEGLRSLSGYIMDVEYDLIEMCCTSADAIQGEAFADVVLCGSRFAYVDVTVVRVAA